MSSGHNSNGRIHNLRVQKALGSEFLIFVDDDTNEVYLVDVQSIQGDPAIPGSVNTEVNTKKIKVPIPVGGIIDKLTETNGNDQVLAIAWTEVKPGNQFQLVLVAVTKSGGSLQFVKCPNASRLVNAQDVPEIKILVKNNEPKLVNVSTDGVKYVLDVFGH